MWSLLGGLLSWVLGFFTGSTRKDEIALGKAQEQVSEGKADMAAVARANQAAKTVRPEGVSDDPNNLDRPS